MPFTAPLWLLSIGKALKRIPWQAWLAFALAGLVWWHFHSVGKAYDRGHEQGVIDEGERIAEKAKALEAAVNALTGKITATIRSKTDEKQGRIAGDADAVRVRGPGQAACAPPSQLASGSGRNGPNPGGNSTVDHVPTGERVELIGLPFPSAVTMAENHDICLAKLGAWQEWYAKQGEAWAKAAK